MPARLTDRNRRLWQTRLEAARLIAQAAHREFRWLWSRLYPQLRRLKQQRDAQVGKRRQSAKLRKQFEMVGGQELWQQFADRLELALRNAIAGGAELIGDVEAEWWARRGREVVIVPQEVVDWYEAQIGRRPGREIRNIADRTRQEIGARIAEWYQTPGTTLQDLVEQLDPFVSESRAQLIAVNEVTALNSAVQANTMQQLGLKRWAWLTRRDEIVCEDTLVGPDGQTWQGCRALHGQVFTVDQPMPPDGSHPGCRCGPQIIVE